MLPSVTVSYAQSLDGRIATHTGSSQWISGPDTLTLAHELRRDHDAVLVGIGTVLADNPKLTCRLPGVDARPLRAVLDSRLRLPESSHLATTARSHQTVAFTRVAAPERRRGVLEELGVRVTPVEEEGGRLSLRGVLRNLNSLGASTVLVEGGSGVITRFLAEGLVRRMVVVIAPIIIGDGVQAVGDLAVSDLSRALRPSSRSVTTMGDDVVWELVFDA
jgi:5-amino-6-(5-phosphoribosylamino)uracil reductase/diaminohydroxyphosphoribosylaminopyrimidine deaminase/5-amino-6-(5-phosphoribosylamino)uracil reductase